MIRIAAALLGLLAVAGCAAERRVEPPPRPMRVVSLDYCADQYVLELLPRERIVAVSPDAAEPFSYNHEKAAGVRQVPSRAEDVLLLEPDLVVRTYGGGPDVARLFAEAGIPVLQIGQADDLPGVRRVLLDVSAGLGEREKGQALADEMDARLARLSTIRPFGDALYMTPGGVTAGPGTLIHELMLAAGLNNFQAEQGWRSLPLERLAYERPDIVAAAFFGVGTNHPDGWSAARHPVARAQLAERPRVDLDGAWTACGGWFVLDAVEALAGRRG